MTPAEERRALALKHQGELAALKAKHAQERIDLDTRHANAKRLGSMLQHARQYKTNDEMWKALGNPPSMEVARYWERMRLGRELTDDEDEELHNDFMSLAE